MIIHIQPETKAPSFWQFAWRFWYGRDAMSLRPSAMPLKIQSWGHKFWLDRRKDYYYSTIARADSTYRSRCEVVEGCNFVLKGKEIKHYTFENWRAASQKQEQDNGKRHEQLDSPSKSNAAQYTKSKRWTRLWPRYYRGGIKNEASDQR